MVYSNLELLQYAWCTIWTKLRVALGQRLFSNYWGKTLPYSKKFQFFSSFVGVPSTAIIETLGTCNP